MSTKRRPGTDLTHDNWDCEEEPEELGEFQKASAEELKNRVFRTAKRRNKLTTSIAAPEDKPASNVFSSFKFGTTDNNSSMSTPNFGLSSNTLTKNLNGTKTASTTISPDAAANNKNNSDEKPSSYYGKLKGLNQTVAAWISKHVDENPICILTPIFDDYAKFLKEIDAESVQSTSSTTQKSEFSFSSTITSNKIDTPNPTKTTEPQKSLFSLPAPSSSNTTTSEPVKSIFSLGSSTTGSSTISPFGGTSATGSTGFSFGTTSTPFTFKNVKPPENAAGTSGVAATEDDDEPPINEFTPVVEEDNIYQKRCKVFVKSKDQYNDRGVGTLYIKSVEDGKKTQLIVRADTNLGNILLNCLLTEAMPISRMGKNNVMIMCIPTPEAEPVPVAVLLRVKTGDEADSLLEVLKKHKK